MNMDRVEVTTRSQTKKPTTSGDIENKSLRSRRSTTSRSSAASSAFRDAAVEVATSKAAEEYTEYALKKQQELKARKSALAEQAAEHQRTVVEQQRLAAEQQRKLELAMEAEDEAHEMELARLAASKATAIATAKLRAIEQCIQDENEEEYVVVDDLIDMSDRTSDWVANQRKVNEESRLDNSDNWHISSNQLSYRMEHDDRGHASDAVNPMTPFTEPSNNPFLSHVDHTAPRVNALPEQRIFSNSPSRVSIRNPFTPNAFLLNSAAIQAGETAPDDIRMPAASLSGAKQPISASNSRETPSTNTLSANSTETTCTVNELRTSPPTRTESFLTEQLSTSLARQSLPKFNPDVFGGDHTLYYPWKQTFQAMLTDAKVGPTQELIYLRNYTTKEPQKLVDSFRRRLYADPKDALGDAWSALDKRFGNTAAIAHAYLEQIEKAAKFSDTDNAKLMEFSNICADVNSQISSLPGLRCLNYSNVLQPVLDKVPRFIQLKWEKIVVEFATAHDNEYPTFDLFSQLISSLSEMKNHPNVHLRKISKSRRDGDITERDTVEISDDVRILSTNTRGPNKDEKICSWHGRKGHDITECYDFSNAPMNDKSDFVMAKGLCFRCLKAGHLSRDCQASVSCMKCKSINHRTEFHTDHTQNRTEQSQHTQNRTENTQNRAGHSLNRPEHTQTRPGNVRTTCTSVCDVMGGGYSCSKTLLVDVFTSNNPRNVKRIYAIIDEQSNASMIRPELIDDLGLTGSLEEYTLSTCSIEKETRHGRRIYGLSVKSIYGKIEPLPTLLECDNIPKDHSGVATPEIASKYSHLKDIADCIPSKDSEAQVMLLIGRDAPEILKVRAFRNGSRGAPWAHKLSLGWTITGQVCLDRLNKAFHVVTNKTSVDIRTHTKHVRSKEETQTTDCPMKISVSSNTNLNDVFETSNDDNDLGMSTEDRKFVDIMDKEFHINSDGNCEMPLPLRDVEALPTNNKDQARKRLLNLQHSFRRKPQMKTHYVEFMTKIFERGHAEVLEESDQSAGKWYLPHFGVYSDKKPNQIRVVFDSSAESCGVSLNKILMSGPDEMNNLVGVLIRFRREDVGIICDIEQMFHSFHVNEDHRDYLRFLWFRDNDPNKEIVECRMRVHLFGNSSSPAIATYGLRRVADMTENSFGSDTRNFIRRNFYVDDGVTSLPTESEAVSLVKNTQAALITCNLRLHKIASNSTSVMNALPEDDRNTNLRDLDLTKDTLPSLRSLGVHWNLEQDTFTYNVTLQDKPYTRRGVLAIVNSVFDPLGFVCPVTIKGKQMLQGLMVSSNDQGTCGWDDDLPPQKRKQWEDWKNDLQHLKCVTTPRCYHRRGFGEIVRREIHAFSDASEDALGVAIYLKEVNSNGEVAISLMFGQAKVTPTRTVTIPRLELCAAVLSAEAANKISKELDVNIDNVFFYTDSKIVLGYIKNETRRFFVYVANRVQKIHNLSDTSQWKYIESENNPADIASRGITSTRIMDSIWFTGPDSLYTNTGYTYVEEIGLRDDDPDVRKHVKVYETQVQSAPKPKSLGTERFRRFSTWVSARRAIAKVSAMVKQKMNKNPDFDRNSAPEELSAYDLHRSEKLIIHECQREAFGMEVETLKKGKSVSEECKSSSLAKLSPFLDDEGIVRVGGRLRHADTPYEEKHPIVLPRNHHITSLIVAHYHERTKHQGRVFTLGALRSAGYWVDNGQKVVADLLRSCRVCRRLRGQPMTQQMADLPEDRVNTSPPFAHIGVDVFGPWVVHTRKLRGGEADNKRWGLVITCLSSRAVHIEVIEKMDASSFIMALRRFFSVRGPSTLIRCDRGTNFVGAKRELEEALSELDQKPIMRFLREEGCEWVFNPPCASHWGGVWERQILTIRRILDTMLLKLGRSALTHEILVTFMAEVSGIVNARPISAIHTDPEDPRPLTPAMLLTLKTRPFSPIPGEYVAQDAYAKRRWRQVQLLANQFWNRWKSEYLQNLQARSKWTSVDRNLKEDDIVVDADMPQYQWPLARVTEAVKSRDGLVRKASVVLVQDGVKKILSRPISKLILVVSSDEN